MVVVCNFIRFGFDICGDSLNAVYYYFDPKEGNRSPGTLNILNLVDFCKSRNIKYVYLGYWVDSVKSMRYKANFKPHSLLINGSWMPGNSFDFDR